MSQRTELGDLKPIYFRTLKEFGRNGTARRLQGRRREFMWREALRYAGVPYVPFQEVYDSWRVFIEGSSAHSGVALNGDHDPDYVSVGVTYHGVVTAAHTTKTASMLRRLLEIYSWKFGTPEEFYFAVMDLCPKPKSEGDGT